MNSSRSGRKGRFKKRLVQEGDLLHEAPLILEKISPFLDLYHKKHLTPAEFTACYILTYLSYRSPLLWAGSKKSSGKLEGIPWRELPFEFHPKIKSRLENTHSLQELFLNFAFKSTPEAVNRAILKWSAGDYGLDLMFTIPKPFEVLEQQIFGRRCVSALVDKRISTYILGERDALSFTMHDLIHADHFYQNQESYEGQLGFYGLLHQTFSFFDLSEEAFQREFEYLISDMNAYPIHLLKCLKSALTYYFDETTFLNWTRLTASPKELLLLNSKDYDEKKMDQVILDWLVHFRA